VGLQDENRPHTDNDGSRASCTAPISFIISVFNGLNYTRACLESLQRTVDLAGHEVIIVDDASTDGTPEFLATLPAPFRVITNSSKRSYAANNNTAARLASNEILCLLNNDTVLFPGWLEPMLHTFALFPSVGFVGNVQRNPRRRRYDHLGVVFDCGGWPTHYGKNFRFRPRHGYSEWRAVTAACCLIKRPVFLDNGGFDEQYINGYEDVDFCLRLAHAGYRHYVANESVIDHHGSSSEGRHAFTPQNEARMFRQWNSYVQQSLTNRDRQIAAANYLLRFAERPWCYNIRRLLDAILCLALLGRFTRTRVANRG
jgi:GT2 family glycosyltransferase